MKMLVGIFTLALMLMVLPAFAGDGGGYGAPGEMVFASADVDMPGCYLDKTGEVACVAISMPMEAGPCVMPYGYDTVCAAGTPPKPRPGYARPLDYWPNPTGTAPSLSGGRSGPSGLFA